MFGSTTHKHQEQLEPFHVGTSYPKPSGSVQLYKLMSPLGGLFS